MANKDRQAQLMEMCQAYGLSGLPNCPLLVGQPYLIRTATYFWLGRFHSAKGNFWKITEPSWIPDTGRFSEMFTKGIENLDQSEVEPVPGFAIVHAPTVVDVVPYQYPPPSSAK